jgi:hypothetical protein
MKKTCLGKGILFWISGTFRHNVGSDDDNGDMINIFCLVRIMMMEKLTIVARVSSLNFLLMITFAVDHT